MILLILLSNFEVSYPCAHGMLYYAFLRFTKQTRRTCLLTTVLGYGWQYRWCSDAAPAAMFSSASSEQSSDRVDSDCAGFIAEQYMFFGVVNEYLGLGPVANIVQKTATVTSDFAQLPYQSYYHGRSSGCGYALFEMVPRIALFATKPARSSPRYLDPEIRKDFDMLEEEILLWDIPTSLNSTTGPDNDEVTAALIQQVALLVTLQYALNGPGMPAPCIQTKIDACVCESRKLLRSISPSSAAWGTLLWPAIHIGSCITSPKGQNELVSAILSMENKAHCCTRLMEFLSSLWVALRDDGMYYGPYEIRPLMDREGIKLSLG